MTGFFETYGEGLVWHDDGADQGVLPGWPLTVRGVDCHLHLSTLTCSQRRSGCITAQLVFRYLTKQFQVGVLC